MPTLSIIIPVYNVESYINQCLDSIVSQTIPAEDFEVIIINDGTRDNSGDIAREYEKKYSNVRVYDFENAGISVARNRGIDLAKGRYIYFVDSDDFIIPNSLRLAYQRLLSIEDENIDLFGFKNIAGDGQENITQIEQQNETSSTLDLCAGAEYFSKGHFLPMVWWYFIRREFLNKLQLKFVPYKTMEDAAFTAEALLAANKIALSELIVYYYRYNPDSLTHATTLTQHMRILEGKLTSAYGFNQLLNKYEHMSYECKQQTLAWRNALIFDVLLKSIRCDTYCSAKKKLKHLRHDGLYPLCGVVRGSDRRIVKYLLPIFNNELIFPLVVSLYQFTQKFRRHKSKT